MGLSDKYCSWENSIGYERDSKSSPKCKTSHHKNIISLIYSHSYLSTPLNTFPKRSYSFCVHFALNIMDRCHNRQKLDSKNHCKHSSRSASTCPVRGFTCTVYPRIIPESGLGLSLNWRFHRNIRQICVWINTHIQVYIYKYNIAKVQG